MMQSSLFDSAPILDIFYRVIMRFDLPIQTKHFQKSFNSFSKLKIPHPP
jgi:hypothetical protein